MANNAKSSAAIKVATNNHDDISSTTDLWLRTNEAARARVEAGLEAAKQGRVKALDMSRLVINDD